MTEPKIRSSLWSLLKSNSIDTSELDAGYLNTHKHDAQFPSLGTVIVSVLEGKQLKVHRLRPCFSANLDDDTYHSPGAEKIGEDDAEQIGNFYHARFGVSEITSDLRIVIFSRNKCIPKYAIGQVIVPLRMFLNTKEGYDSEHNVYTLAGWFKLLPLPFNSVKFNPATPVVAKTGLPKMNLGYVKIVSFLNLRISRKNLWMRYLTPPLRSNMASKPVNSLLNSTNNPLSGNLRSSTRTMVDASKKLRSNILRVKVANDHFHATYVNEILSFLSYLRSWDSPVVNVQAFSLLYILLFWIPIYMLPMILVLALYFGSKSKLSETKLVLNWTNVKVPERRPLVHPIDIRKDRDFLVWNNEISDPRDDMGLLKKWDLYAYQLNYVQEKVGVVASIYEKLINCFNFADENASKAFFGLLLATSLGTSLTMYLAQLVFSHVDISAAIYTLFIVGFAPPLVRKVAYAPVKAVTFLILLIKSPSNGSGFSKALWESFRGLYYRIPNTNEMGHRYIAQTQLVKRFTNTEELMESDARVTVAAAKPKDGKIPPVTENEPTSEENLNAGSNYGSKNEEEFISDSIDTAHKNKSSIEHHGRKLDMVINKNLNTIGYSNKSLWNLVKYFWYPRQMFSPLAKDALKRENDKPGLVCKNETKLNHKTILHSTIESGQVCQPDEDCSERSSTTTIYSSSSERSDEEDCNPQHQSNNQILKAPKKETDVKCVQSETASSFATTRNREHLSQDLLQMKCKYGSFKKYCRTYRVGRSNRLLFQALKETVLPYLDEMHIAGETMEVGFLINKAFENNIKNQERRLNDKMTNRSSTAAV